MHADRPGDGLDDVPGRGIDGRTHTGFDPLAGRSADRRPEAEGSPFLRAVRENCALEDLRLAGRPSSHRFGRVLPAEVRNGRRDRAVQLRRFEVPAGADAAAEQGFGELLADQLARWAAVGDLDGIVRPLDASDAPEPWAVTPSATATLAERDRTLETGLCEGISLADTLASLHDRCTIHAGIDPTNVVYLESTTGPHLDGVGLLDVYRRYADPAGYLDARFAAPEYFEVEPGVLDRAADIYQLGAVVFWLCTGQPPVEGSAAEISDRVTRDEPLPRPSTVEERLPAAVDDVVLRATATEKFDRFDSAGEFAAALREAAGDLLE